MASWTSRFTCVAAASALVLGASNLSAQSADEKQTIQVLTVFSNTAYAQAESFSIALKRAVDRSKSFRLARGDFSLEVLTAALNCPEIPDDTCLKKISSHIKTEQFVWGSVEKQGGDVVGTLHLYNPKENSQTSVRYSSNLSDASDETLLEIAASAFAELTGTAPGKLVITANTAGTLRIGEEIIRNIPEGKTELVLPGGEHQLTFTAPGFKEQVSTVSIVSGGQATLSLKPPVEAAGGSGSSFGSGPEDRGESTGMSNRKLIGLGSMGAGGALLAGAVFSALKVNSINNDDGFDRYRRSVSEGEDVCESADAGKSYLGAPSPGSVADQCSSASTFQTLQWVFAGVGALATGVGAYLFFSDDSPKNSAQKTPRIDTQVGHQGGRIQLTLSF